jgi:DNA sulfur modification protein DndE
MKAPIDAVRLTASEKDLLSRIKRKTAVESWNVLCRWALAVGLSSNLKHLTRSPEKRDAVEIRWDTFAGRWSDAISASIRVAHQKYSESDQGISLGDFFQMVMARGVRILAKQASTNGSSCFAGLIKSGNFDRSSV